MAGYIGSKSSVTQVDGYSEAEADAEFVTKTGDTMTGDLVVENSSGATINVNTGLAGAVSKVILHEGSTASPANGATLEYDGATNLFSIGVGSDISTKRLSIARDTGNVGIGTSSPEGKTHIQSEVNAFTDLDVGTNYHLNLHNPENDINEAVGLSFSISTGHDIGASIFHERKAGSSAGDLMFATRPSGGNVTERMRIDASGNLLVGASSFNGGSECLKIERIGTINIGTNSTAGRYRIQFFNPNGFVGSIATNGNGVQFNTSSDYRLKENVVDLTGASARVNLLNPSRFNFISDDTNTLVDGFLAHEVADVVPEAIHGTKDAMKDEEYEVTPAVEATYDEDGNELTAAVEAVMGTRSVPDYQGIDQSKLVPLLTAALQEALTEIASLKTRVQALEDV